MVAPRRSAGVPTGLYAQVVEVLLRGPHTLTFDANDPHGFDYLFDYGGDLVNAGPKLAAAWRQHRDWLLAAAAGRGIRRPWAQRMFEGRARPGWMAREADHA
jgi:hypothetical protein